MVSYISMVVNINALIQVLEDQGLSPALATYRKASLLIP